MFTGIISHTAKFKENKNSSFTFTAEKSFLSQIKQGSSVAVNGACLTITLVGKSSFSVNLMPETLRKTAFGQLKRKDLVNLELPLAANGTFDGHIVLGHVDGVAQVAKISKEGGSRNFRFKIGADLSWYLVSKGSVAVNGISLTVIDAGKNYFTVGIIPYTWENTMVANLEVGSKVNIEVDILAKYVEKLIRR